MSSIKAAKQDARILRKYLNSQNITLSQSQALEAVARLAKQRNWATFIANQRALAKLSPSRVQIENWPVFVFALDEDEETLTEGFYVLPFGTRIDDESRYLGWGLFDDSDREALSEAFKLADDVVVTSVHSLLPRIDKYGLPTYANECEAAKFFREVYGLAAVDDLEVSFKDTGEDSGNRVWFEARVHPDTAAKLKRFLARQ